MIAAEHHARAAETGDHFVGDEKRAALVRGLANGRQKSLRRHDVASRALNRLDDDRRGSSGGISTDHAPQCGNRAVGAFGLRAVEAGRVGIGGEVVPCRKRSDGGLPRDIGERQDTRRLSVETAGEADHVGAFRVRAREPNSGLDGLGAAAEELGPFEVAWREVGDEADQLRARPRREAADRHRLELRDERRYIPGM